MATTLGVVTNNSSNSSSTPSSPVCPSFSCDRKAIWHRPVETSLDFTLDLNIDPAADRGCCMRINCPSSTSKTKDCSTSSTKTEEPQDESTTRERRSRRPRVFNTSEPDDSEEEGGEEEEEGEEGEEEEEEGEEEEEEEQPMAIDEGSTTTPATTTPAPTPSTTPPKSGQFPSRVNLLEPEGVETRLCGRHVEQLMRERLFLFGEDCNYSLWWFPKADYTSAVWRTEEGAGFQVGDPDFVTLNDKVKAAKAAKSVVDRDFTSSSSSPSKNKWIPIAVPAIEEEGENALKKRKASPSIPSLNITPSTPPSTSEPVATTSSSSSSSTSSSSSSPSSTEVEADGIGEELKSLILSEGQPSAPLITSISPSNSPSGRRPLRLFIGNNGVLTSKKRLVEKPTTATIRSRSRFGSIRSSTSTLRTSNPTLKTSASSLAVSNVPTARQFAPGVSMHRVRWLRNRELGSSGCGPTPTPALFHRHERSRGYYVSSSLPPTLLTASFQSRMTSRSRAGVPADESPPSVPEGTRGGGGGMGCDGPVRVWSGLKNISHLYHVVPLDQSEAEITLEELSHPDVFSDARIGCSVQLLHSQGANRDQQEQEQQQQETQRQERLRQLQLQQERQRRQAELDREQREQRNPRPSTTLEAPQTVSRVSVRRSESTTDVVSSTSSSEVNVDENGREEEVTSILNDFYEETRVHSDEVTQSSSDQSSQQLQQGGSGSRIRSQRMRHLLVATATPPRRRPEPTTPLFPPTVQQFRESEIVRSSRTSAAPSTPSRTRLRRSQQTSFAGEDTQVPASSSTEPMDENDVPSSVSSRMQRRRSTVSAAALSASSGPHVKVVSTTTPLAYKRRGGEDLLAQLFEAGVHCRPRHKYVSFVDVPLPAISPVVGWPGLEEFLARFRLMCTMSGVAIVNESRDRRRRVFVGRSSDDSTPALSISSPVHPSKLTLLSGARLSPSSSSSTHPLRHSSSGISNSASVVMDDNKEEKGKERDDSSVSSGSGSRSTMDWILVRERATMIIDLRRPLTNYGSFWNEHYFRRRLSMPMHGTVLATRSDPVFATKNPEVISHYLGDANGNSASREGGGPTNPIDGRQPVTWNPNQKLPPSLVPSDPTIVHQSYTLTFYPDLDGNFSASLEYLTLHSPNCSVSTLDHARRRMLLKRQSQVGNRNGSTTTVDSSRASDNPRGHQTSRGGARSGGRQTRRTSASQLHGYSSNVWRSIEDVVAGLKVPESSKSTHTYKQDVLDKVIELLKERTCNTLAQEELSHRLQEQAAQNRSSSSSTSGGSDPLPMDLGGDTTAPASTTDGGEDGAEEDAEDLEFLREFGLLEEIEEELKQGKDIMSQYRNGPPVRWTFLPSLQFYQTRISL